MSHHINLLTGFLFLALMFGYIIWQIVDAFELCKRDKKETISKDHKKQFGV